jgi:plasmid replication initiation protein
LALANTDTLSSTALLHAQRDSGFIVRVTAKDFADSFGIEMNTAYEQIKTASQKIFERYIRNKIKTKKGYSDHFIRWVSSAKYAEGEGWVELRFTPEVAPHVMALRQNFTSYKLKHTANLDSVHSWRLYELLRSWMSTGLYTPSIDEFHNSMDTAESFRKNFADLRRKVIEPAVRAINERTDLQVVWEPVRAGSRKITSLRFEFKPDLQTKIEFTR